MRIGILVLLVFGLFLACEGTNRRRYDRGYSLRFDAARQHYVDLSTSILFGATDLTFEFLINPKSVSRNTAIISFGHNRYPAEIYYSSNRQVVFRSETRTVVSSQTLTWGQWSYIAITVRQNGQVRILTEDANGDIQQIGSGNIGCPISVLRGPNYIGRDQSNVFFGGDLDEIRIWSSLISDNELSSTRVIDAEDESLLLYYNFDEAIGTTAIDASGHNYLGSLGGGNASRIPDYIVSACVQTKTCNLWCDSVKTFDRLVYQFSRTGEFVLSQSSGGDIVIQIRADTKPNRRNEIDIIGLAFKYFDDLIIFDLDYQNKATSTLTVNGQLITAPSIELATSNILINKITQNRRTEHTWEIDVPFTFNLKIEAKPDSYSNRLFLRVPSDFAGTLLGLCGDFDGDRSNDNQPQYWTPGVSLWSNNWNFQPDPSGFTCSVEDKGPEFRDLAYRVCNNTAIVAIEYRETCLQQVCISGDIGLAQGSAEATYDDCLERKASNQSDTSICTIPCPNFCSFQGTCSSGVCTCDQGWYGRDCSQQREFPCYTAQWTYAGDSRSSSIRPFSGSQTVENYYSYNQPFRASSNTGNEISQSTVVFLYQEVHPPTRDNQPVIPPKLSAIVLNDKPQDGSAGRNSLSLKVRDGTTRTTPVQGLSIRVKDDRGDRYDDRNIGTTGVASANWRWWKCCTDGMALGYLPLTNFCASFNFTGLEGINQIVVASENIYGAQEIDLVSNSPAGGSVTICGDKCNNTCGTYSDCSSCSADPKCGWCVESGTCELGTAIGPQEGRCLSWRFSTNPAISRVSQANVDYPVDPSYEEYYLAPSSTLESPFFVEFPSDENVPLEVVILQDLSSAFSADLRFLQASLVQLYSQILSSFPLARIGISSFADKPVTPYGSPTRNDFVYATNQPLTTNKVKLQQALNYLVTVDGGDTKQAQLEALLQVATRQDIDWTPNARHVVVVVTKSPFHANGDTNLPANNGDGVLAGTPQGSGEDYPSRDQVKQALLAANIIPVFVTPSSVSSVYQTLIAQWSFGYSYSFSALNVYSIFSQILDAMSVLSSSAVPLIQQNGALTGISPSSYSGISPMTRVSFKATFAGTSTQDTIVVVPGFGKVTFKRIATDLPVSSCTMVDTQSGQDASSHSGEIPTIEKHSVPRS